MDTRRNIIKIGAIAAAASLAKIKTARAAETTNYTTADGGEKCVCLERGTLIKTPNGLVAVEDLEIGDLIETRDNGALPILAMARFKTTDEACRVNGKLVVTKPHGIVWNGAVVDAGLLIDTPQVTLLPRQEREFFNPKLETHSIIYANGIEVESLDGPGVRPGKFERISGFPGARAEIMSHVRSLISTPLKDFRQPVDIYRELLETSV